MDPDLLRSHLIELHDELAAVHRVDPQSRQLLGEVMRDIARLMDESAAAASGSSPDRSVTDRSLPDRLERIAVQFEVDHPTLASSTRRLVDMLGKVGL
jgi:hypothetical protein